METASGSCLRIASQRRSILVQASVGAFAALHQYASILSLWVPLRSFNLGMWPALPECISPRPRASSMAIPAIADSARRPGARLSRSPNAWAISRTAWPAGCASRRPGPVWPGRGKYPESILCHALGAAREAPAHSRLWIAPPPATGWIRPGTRAIWRGPADLRAFGRRPPTIDLSPSGQGRPHAAAAPGIDHPARLDWTCAAR